MCTEVAIKHQSDNAPHKNFPFEITITAPVGTDNTFEKTFFLDFDVSLYQVNWPWYSDVAVRSNPIVIDTGVDEAKEILVVDSN